MVTIWKVVKTGAKFIGKSIICFCVIGMGFFIWSLVDVDTYSEFINNWRDHKWESIMVYSLVGTSLGLYPVVWITRGLTKLKASYDRSKKNV